MTALPVTRKLIYATVTVALLGTLAEAVLWGLGTATVAERRDPFRGFAGDAPVFERRGETFTTDRPANHGTFNPQSFAAAKPAEGFRVFVLGGSSAYGFPWGAGVAFPAILDDLLQAAHPALEIEVVNAAGVSYGSHRLRMLVHELLRYDPDLLIVYGGHNEFIEEQVHRALRARFRPPRGIERALHRSRVYGALEALLNRAPRRRDWQAGPEGTLATHVRRAFGHAPDAARRRELESFFGDNLRAIVAAARRQGVPVVLCTVPSNLRGWRPEREPGTPRLDEATRQDWERRVSQGESALAAGDLDEAVERLRGAAALTPEDAPTWFLLARALDARGDHPEARAAYTRALERDARPDRATPAINDAIREVAARSQAALVDVERLFESRSPGGIVGFELIEDYVHPTVEGHGLIAAEVWKTLRAAEIPEPIAAPDVDRLLAEVLRARNPEPGPASATWFYNQAMLLANQGRPADARAKLEQALDLAPDWAEAHFSLGSVLLQVGEIDDAARRFESAAALDPDVADLGLAQYNLGVALARAGRVDQAIERFRHALELRPGDANAHNNLATLLARRGELREAERHLRRALALDPSHPDAINNLERLRRALAGRE